jgi:hypothetical protein
MGNIMSSMVLSGDTSGAVTVTVPAVAGTNTVTIPAVTGTAVIGSSAVSAVGQIPFSTDGSSYTPTAKIVSGTAVASTSGTSIDFTGIPSWVKRITVMFNGVSTNGTSNVLVQIGSGSLTISGYVGRGGYFISGGASYVVSQTTGFGIDSFSLATETRTGQIVINLIGSNTYVATAQVCSMGSAIFGFGNGAIGLSGLLDRVRITTVNGTDTFDAGSINILYE